LNHESQIKNRSFILHPSSFILYFAEVYVKAIAGILLGIVAVLGIAGGAIATGIVRLPFSPPETSVAAQIQAQVPATVQSSPPLQPASAQSTDGADMIVTLSERFLNRKIVEGMPQGDEISNPQIDLHADALADFTATVRSGFLTVTPRASVRLAVQNGRIVIDVLNVDVGGFGVPSSMIQPQIDQLKATAETELNKQFADLEKTTGLKLHSLTTTENSLTLYFAP
jgi:hypothetical protein